MKNGNIKIHYLIILAILQSFTVQVASIDLEYDPRDLQFESEMEIKNLDEIQHYADEAVMNQNTVLKNIAENIDQFITDMKQIGDSVSESIEIWVESPTVKNEAMVSQRVCQAAVKGRKAAESIIPLLSGVKNVTDKLHDGLSQQISQARNGSNGAESQVRKLNEELKNLESVALQAKRQIVAQGITREVDIPAKLADKLFRLAVDYQELEIIAELWTDASNMIEGYVRVMEQAQKDFQDIERIASAISYQSASAGRIFSTIGKAESMKIRTRMIADAYTQSLQIQDRIQTSFKEMQNIHNNLKKVAYKGRGMPPVGDTSLPRPKQDIAELGIMKWLETLESRAETIPADDESQMDLKNPSNRERKGS